MPLTSPRIVFRGVRPAEGLQTEVQRHLLKLRRYYRGLLDCHVLIEQLARHHRYGNRYHVRVDLIAPGATIVVSREADLHAAAAHTGADRMRKTSEADPQRKHLRQAIREAFVTARRQLQDYARRRRGAVKVHQIRRQARPARASARPAASA